MKKSQQLFFLAILQIVPLYFFAKTPMQEALSVVIMAIFVAAGFIVAAIEI